MRSRLPQFVFISSLRSSWNNFKLSRHLRKNNIHYCMRHGGVIVVDEQRDRNEYSTESVVQCLVCKLKVPYGVHYSYENKLGRKIIRPKISDHTRNNIIVGTTILLVLSLPLTITYYSDNNFNNRMKQADKHHKYRKGEAALCNIANNSDNHNPRHWVDCSIESRDGQGIYTIRHSQGIVDGQRILDIKPK